MIQFRMAHQQTLRNEAPQVSVLLDNQRIHDSCCTMWLIRTAACWYTEAACWCSLYVLRLWDTRYSFDIQRERMMVNTSKLSCCPVVKETWIDNSHRFISRDMSQVLCSFASFCPIKPYIIYSLKWLSVVEIELWFSSKNIYYTTDILYEYIIYQVNVLFWALIQTTNEEEQHSTKRLYDTPLTPAYIIDLLHEPTRE